jgi:hypothetical protein
MKTMAKAALGALALAALGAGTTGPANAQTSFGFSFGSGPYYGDYRSGYYGNPCYRPYRFRPAYCFRRGPGYGYYARPAYRSYGYNDYRYRDYRRPYWR